MDLSGNGRNPTSPKPQRAHVVLIVDDEPSVRFFLRNYLQSIGVTEIVEAANGQEAVQQLRGHPMIRVIITDLKMPVMDGVDAIRQFRAINPSAVIVVLTGYTRYRGILETAEGGALVMMKPIELDELDRVMDMSLTRASLLP
ncbi:MAG: response regulator [Candidatus Omnitrophica bacterium]|nr:response regulator [Candidatus Omnitrophota bacterium]